MGKKRCSDDDALLPVCELIQIFVWLPVVSLLRFKSVCKSWRDLIQSSSFIDLHTANTFNSSSSSNNQFGSFILPATVDRHWWSPPGVAGPEHLREYALLMLSSSSTEEYASKSGSSTGWWWWSSTASNYPTDAAVKEEEEEELPDYDDQVFTVDYNTNLLGGGGRGSTSNEDDQQQQKQQLVFKLESLWFPPCFKFRDNYFFTDIVGSCNGLVCLFDDENKDVSLWNPATRQFRLLPKSITIDDNCRDRWVSFGFDVQTKDYKVLLVVTCSNPNHYRLAAPVECLCRVQVYSLSSNSWRLLEGINCLPGYPQYRAMEGYMLYLNGSCFFIANFFFSKWQKCFPENNRFIISFDFTKEIFTPMQLPNHHRDQELYISSLGDKIAIFIGAHYSKDVDGTDVFIRHPYYKIHPGISKIFDIWVLNNEHSSSSSSSSSSSNNNICSVNKESSWTKLYSFRIELERPGERIIPRGISNDGEFAMIETKYSFGVGKKMKLYNLVTKEVKKNFLACSTVRSKANAYKPSLVSIVGGNGSSSRSSSSR